MKIGEKSPPSANSDAKIQFGISVSVSAQKPAAGRGSSSLAAAPEEIAEALRPQLSAPRQRPLNQLKP
jgi:hypothetical protein